MDRESVSSIDSFAGFHLPTEIFKLLDDAAASFDGDREVARDCIARAAALLQSQQPDRHPAAGWRVHEHVARGGLAPWQVRRLIAYIDTRIAGTIRAEELADLVRLSVSHFSRAFKVSFGESPLRYATVRRIERAKMMMTTTDEPLCQIAMACGLCDQSHFCRVFLRTVGVTPNVWRRQNSSRARPMRNDEGHGREWIRSST